MQAHESQLKVLLGGEKQFVIPLFQRPYSWTKPNWETLWKDVLETYEIAGEGRHFLGSIVTKALPADPTGVGNFLVIDGQQRLTTLTLVLAAIRDAVRDAEPKLARKIHELYLTNEYASGLAEYKVLPTQVDRTAYFEVVDWDSDSYDAGSRIGRAYTYYRDRLRESDSEGDPLDLARLEQVIMGSVELVSIRLSEADNEYRIFESLNWKGADLTQADLLRNYFFMRIPLSQQEQVYDGVWLPMQKVLGNDELQAFFRYEFMADGEFVREGDVYQEWKKRLDKLPPDQLVDRLKLLAKRSRYYKRLISPEEEPDERVARGLARLNRWGGRTMYPFLLWVYRQRDRGAVDAQGFARILGMIESFLVRRMFASVPTAALNRLFLRLGSQVGEDGDIVEGTRAELADPGKRWPRDEEVVAGVLTYPLYTDARPDQRRLILETLEESFGSKEQVNLHTLTVEHVMPRTLTPAWEEMLGEDAGEVHRKQLHVLGNLTLTGYNSPLSNRPFAEKRELLAQSNLQMNKEIATHQVWTGRQIEDRGRRLAERAIDIWAGPVTQTAAGVGAGAAADVVAQSATKAAAPAEEQTALEIEFHEAMLWVYEQAKSECDYPAQRFYQMVLRDGGLPTAKTLLRGDTLADGLVKLWECGRLDISIEALVINPRWQSLFSPEERAVAQTRLQELGYHLSNEQE